MSKLLVILLSTLVINSLALSVNINIVTAETFKQGLEKSGKEIGYDVDTLKNQTLAEPLARKIGKVINIILSFLGVIFLVLMIYGGYIWMTARGNDQGTEKAKTIIRNALIGVFIALAAFIITNFAVYAFHSGNLQYFDN
ncbi:MAG: hypothetical protein ABIE43_01395 [Patescibacteria group bacterium]